MNTTQKTILIALQRQPMTAHDISSGLGMHSEKVRVALARMVRRDVINRKGRKDVKTSRIVYLYSANPVIIAPARAGS